MVRRPNFFWAMLIGVLTLTDGIQASTPQFLEFLSQEELLKGNLKGVSLTSDGKIVLAPRVEMIFDTEQAYLFSMAKDNLGNIYVGSGHDGKVFKTSGPREGEKAKGELFFKAKELDIYALAVDSQNNLYVGSSPDGKVYKVSPNKSATEFFEPKEKYIWALAMDKNDNLYVSTGVRGIIYKVDKTGKGKRFFDSQETHIMCMTLDSDGNLIAGSSPNGYVYRIAPEGKGFVLYDSHLNEIHALSLDRFGTIYAASLNQSPSTVVEPIPTPKAGHSPTVPLAPLATEGATITVQASDESRVESRSTASGRGLDKELSKIRSAVHLIFKDNSVETLWTSKEDVVYSLLVQEDGTIMASTGTKGRILAINPQREVTILVESSEEQITAMVARGDTIYAASSNLAKVLLLKPEKTQEGYYESEVKDTKTISAWGMISWYANNSSPQSVELYTRTGNTEKSNKTWSEWTGPYKFWEGEPIKSPNARYIQWKAVLKSNAKAAKSGSQTAEIEKVNIAYLQQNIRPRISSINVLPPGIALQKLPLFGPTYSTSPMTSSLSGLATASSASYPASPVQPKSKFKPPPQQRPQPGARSILWKGEDDNDDELMYQIYFKAEGEHDWKLLEKDLPDEFYTIDSNALPDGVYQIKVIASDAPSNPYGKALTAERISKPFVIDNTPPVIEILSHRTSNKKVEINFRAKDTVSKILQAEFSIDGGDWHIVFPKDGISDSKIEDYRVTIDNLKEGEHTIGLKAMDAMGNVGTNKLVIKN